MKTRYLLLLVLLATQVRSQSTTWYVNQNATGANTGQNWQNAYKDLHEALQSAQSNDAIWVAKGTYFPDAGFNRDRYFELKSGVKIYGGFSGTEILLSQRDIPANPVVLSGNIGNPQDSTDNSYTILYMAYPDSSTRIDGFTFQHGFAKNDTNFYTLIPTTNGGAVFILAQNGKAQPVFANCSFRNNAARFNGGAVYVQGEYTQGSTPIFEYCSFFNNQARLGGAIYMSGGNKYDRGKEFYHCTFESNKADIHGGAIYNNSVFGNEVLDFESCIIKGNNCSLFGAFFACQKWGVNKISTNIDSCKLIENGPNASNLFYVGNAGQLFKAEFYLSNSDIIGNKLNNLSLSSTELFSMEPGIKPSGTDSIVVKNNRFINNDCTISFNAYGDFTKCEDNFVLNSPGLGAAGNEIIFTRNIQINYQSSGFVFLIGEKKSFAIKNNIFFGGQQLIFSVSSFEGGQVENFDTINVFNNIFIGNDVAIFQYSNYYMADLSYRINIYNNIFSNNESTLNQYTHPDVISQDSSFFLYNLMDQPCSSISAPRVICGAGNIVSDDPLFVNPAAFDFRLQPCSPAINAGDNTYLQYLGILEDLAGDPRIAEGIVDIGAYESPAFALATTPQIQPACTNSPGGAISLTTANGCEPFSYTWSPPAGNGASINDLPPGDYHFTVTDNRGRQITSLATVPAAPSPVLTPAIQDLQCGFIAGGSITANVNSGTAPFSFVWENGATGIQRDMLPAGQYQVTVTDASGCQDSAQIHIQQSGQITLQVDGQPISCFGAADAQLSATAATGKAPFSYLWSQGATDSLLSPLGPGQYTVTVSDAYGCTATFSFNLSDPPPLQAAAIAQPTNNLQNPSGSVTAIPSGGTPTHTYTWSNGGLTQTISNLPPGVYTVTVTDAHGCSATATAEVKLVISTGEAPGLAVQVWPNPMRERLEISALQLPSGTYRFVLRDVLGREVASAAVAGGRAVLATGDLPPGAYLWYLETEDGAVASGKVLR